MSHFSGRSRFEPIISALREAGASLSQSKSLPYLALPIAIVAIVALTAFRPSRPLTDPIGNPLHLPAGWPMPNVPADNPITMEKFTLGRMLFYESAMSGDNKTSCSSCHNPRLSFSSIGPHSGAFSETGKPARNVPRIVNVAYDSVLTWDGHLHTLEQQVHAAVLKKGDLQGDTVVGFRRLVLKGYSPAFAKAFGDSTITLDRVAQAIATFERCLISGNSPYDQYQRGDKTALTPASLHGMKLFFDTTKTNCSLCHNNCGKDGMNSGGQSFTDNAYYRTGTFEGDDGRGGGGYGFNPPQDTSGTLDPGRAAVTQDSMDIGRFRTPSLRNVSLTSSLGAASTVHSLRTLLEVYNAGGSFVSPMAGHRESNKDKRIVKLNLTEPDVSDLASFISDLTDVSFLSNPDFQDPGAPSAGVRSSGGSGNLAIYPNPSSGPVTLQCPDFSGAVGVRLISNSGATAWRGEYTTSGKLQLDFAGIANGSYILELISSERRQTLPIVIRH